MSSDEEKEPVKVPGNSKGAVLKPDGSVPVAGEEWAVKADGSLGVFVKGKVTDGSTQWRVCASGQACAHTHGRIHVLNVTSGKGNTLCDHCQDRANGVTQHRARGGCRANVLPRPDDMPKCRNNPAHKCTGSYMTFKWEGKCCNGTCANAIAKVLYQHDHEGVPYPEGFRMPPSTSSQSTAAKRAK